LRHRGYVAACYDYLSPIPAAGSFANNGAVPHPPAGHCGTLRPIRLASSLSWGLMGLADEGLGSRSSPAASSRMTTLVWIVRHPLRVVCAPVEHRSALRHAFQA